jgi:hypothetical protein
VPDYNEESSDDEILPKSEPDEDVTTEPADDEEYMAAGPSTRKRKRGIKVESPTVEYQPKSRKGGKPSGSARQVKRARAASSSSNTAYGTRVFALWRKDGNYYSGVVHSQTGQGRYIVHFDDETSDEVRLDQMRLCVLKVGDSVFIAGVSRAVKISDVLDENTVTVSTDAFSKDVNVPHVRIGARTITSSWTDRVVTAQSVVCQVKPYRSFTSPTPSRFSISSVGSSKKTSDLFARIGFCITHASGAEKEKEAMAARIKSSGGIVIDDWEDVIPMKGRRSNNNTRWILKDTDAVATFGGVERVFLLAEDATQTPKYLIALALGIPCLRVDFIKRAIETVSPNPRTREPF